MKKRFHENIITAPHVNEVNHNLRVNLEDNLLEAVIPGKFNTHEQAPKFHPKSITHANIAVEALNEMTSPISTKPLHAARPVELRKEQSTLIFTASLAGGAIEHGSYVYHIQ